jgi:hypothetical protein
MNNRLQQDRLTSQHPLRNLAVVLFLALSAPWFADLAARVFA